MLDILYVEVYINLIKNSNILITGTSSGIGLELAKKYLKNRNKIWGCSRSSKKISNKNYFHTKLDLVNKKKIEDWISKVEKQSKNRIDIFISNAAHFNRRLHSLDTFDAIDKSIKINLTAPILITNKISKLMIQKQKGLIIFFSSVAVAVNQLGSSTYSASKSGIETFSKNICNELKKFNIKIGTIRILYIPTKLSNKLNRKEIKNLRTKFKTNKFNNVKKIFNKINEIYNQKNVVTNNVFFDNKKPKNKKYE